MNPSPSVQTARELDWRLQRGDGCNGPGLQGNLVTMVTSPSAIRGRCWASSASVPEKAGTWPLSILLMNAARVEAQEAKLTRPRLSGAIWSSRKRWSDRDSDPGSAACWLAF